MNRQGIAGKGLQVRILSPRPNNPVIWCDKPRHTATSLKTALFPLPENHRDIPRHSATLKKTPWRHPGSGPLPTRPRVPERPAKGSQILSLSPLRKVRHGCLLHDLEPARQSTRVPTPQLQRGLPGIDPTGRRKPVHGVFHPQGDFQRQGAPGVEGINGRPFGTPFLALPLSPSVSGPLAARKDVPYAGENGQASQIGKRLQARATLRRQQPIKPVSSPAQGSTLEGEL